MVFINLDLNCQTRSQFKPKFQDVLGNTLTDRKEVEEETSVQNPNKTQVTIAEQLTIYAIYTNYCLKKQDFEGTL